MKRILLLIFLVMMATWLLRAGARFDARMDVDEPELSHLSRSMLRPSSTHSQRSRPTSSLRPRNLPSLDTDRSETDATSRVDFPTRRFESQMMATEDRAEADAISKLDEALADWLSPEVPATWKPSNKLVRSMIRDLKYTPVVKDYGTLYIAELTADTSAKRREKIIEAYHRESIRHRMLALGGSLAFVLVCLGIVSGYIRADEATKGYYTNRLRMLAAAGVGAAGVTVYRLI